MIKNILINKFPGLGKYKRYLTALKDSILPVRDSYSQHKEDEYIWKILQNYNLEESCFIDIGANHPTDISNTYLLYRKGIRGIVVEPNVELGKLFRYFRKEDILLTIGCANETSILPFNISKTPVISTFSQKKEINVYKTVYIPVMSLDSALRHFNLKFINLLSIDTEGFNILVLKGGKETISKSLIICIEFDAEDEKKTICDLLGTQFELLKAIVCNLIFLNSTLASNKFKDSKQF